MNYFAIIVQYIASNNLNYDGGWKELVGIEGGSEGG